MRAAELVSQRTPEPGEEETLDLLTEAENVKAIMADFRDIVEYLHRTKIIPSPYHAGPHVQSPSHDLLCLTKGTTSMILRRDGNAGGIHFIEVDKNKGPRSYGHTQTAITKAREFLEQFRMAINAS